MQRASRPGASDRPQEAEWRSPLRARRVRPRGSRCQEGRHISDPSGRAYTTREPQLQRRPAHLASRLFLLRTHRTRLRPDRRRPLLHLFQRDPERQFIPIQRRLAAADALNRRASHTASAIFALPAWSEARRVRRRRSIRLTRRPPPSLLQANAAQLAFGLRCRPGALRRLALGGEQRRPSSPPSTGCLGDFHLLTNGPGGSAVESSGRPRKRFLIGQRPRSGPVCACLR